jgi:hypothetical protein
MLNADEYGVQGKNANNVNLNYNFEYEWGTAPASHDPARYYYCGPSVESEPETKVMRRFFENWLPRHLCFLHDGSSGYSVWYAHALDAVDKTLCDTVYLNYKSKALEAGRSVLGYAEEEASGHPSATAYHYNDKKILGWMVECCTLNPSYETIATTHWPNIKPWLITLSQDAEVLPPPPPPGKGTLYCRAFANSTEVAASVEVVAVGTYTTPFSIELGPGTYTLKAAYQGQMREQVVAVVEEKITEVTFFFVKPPSIVPLLLVIAGVVFLPSLKS